MTTVGLILDTSREWVAAALVQQGHIIRGHCRLHHQQLHSLFPTILDELFQNMAVQDLAFMAFGSGPGSHTGVRVAATVATAIHAAHGIPLLPIPSLLFFLPDLPSGSFAISVAAKNGLFHIIEGSFAPFVWKPLSQHDLDRASNIKADHLFGQPWNESPQEPSLTIAAKIASELYHQFPSGKPLSLTYLN